MATISTWTRAAMAAAAALAATGAIDGAVASPELDAMAPSPAMVTADWADRVDIEVVGQHGAIAPTIAIMHDKTVVDGALGQGFRLAASGAIRQSSSTGGAPQHTAARRFTLDGAELVAVTGVSPPLYTLRINDGAQIAYRPDDNVFVATKDGWRRTYGALDSAGANATLSMPATRAARRGGLGGADLPGVCETASAAPAQCDTAEWRLSLVEDPFGNRIIYDYAALAPPAGLAARYGQAAVDPVLASIRWETAAGEAIGEVVFDYAPRLDPQLDYLSGAPRLQAHRVTDIRSFARGAALAQYRLEYQDQGGEDCDGNAAAAVDGAQRARLRRIVQVSVDDPQATRLLRCFQTADAPIDATSWGAPEVSDWLSPNSGGYGLIAVLPATLNDDALSDLILLREDGAHEARVASRPGLVGDIFDYDASNPALVALRARLRERLSEDYLSDGYGWALADFSGDGRPDLLADDLAGGARELDVFDRRTGARTSVAIPVGRCDLIAARTADIDGDGFLDLVFLPRAAEGPGDAPGDRARCAGRTASEWMRNLGRAPWFDPSDADGSLRPLRPPLLSGGLGLIGTNQGVVAPAGEIRVAGLDVSTPFGEDLWPTPRQFVVDQLRFSDVNGDGVADITVALHRQWSVSRVDGSACSPAAPGSDDERCQWRAVADTEFSRIYWGTGYGGFVDSGLSAGPATLDQGRLGDSAQYFTTYRLLADLDRQGRAGMLVGDGVGARVDAVPFRGVAQGFGETPIGQDGSAAGLDIADGARLPFDLYPYTPCPGCKNGAYQPVFADFDGDGFADLLEIRLSPSTPYPSGPCAGRRRCLTVSYATRQTAQGRLIASDGPWGGRTTLDWRHYGAELSDDGVTRAVEVLAAENGADGERRYAYARARERDGGFAGLGLSAMRRAAGGVDVFARAVSPILDGAPLYVARYRKDFTLERAQVFAYGVYEDDRYAVATRAPYDNPRLRECLYEVERQADAPRIARLLKDCWRWGRRAAPSHNQLLAMAGFDADPDPSVGPIAALANGAPQTGPGEAALDPAGGDAKASLWEPPPPGLAAPVGPRWPTSIAFDPAPDPEAYRQATPQSAFGAGFRRFVTDWERNDAVRRPARKIMHRDTRRGADDLIEEYRWENAPDAAGARLLETTLTDRRGRVLRTVSYGDFAGFQTAGSRTECGAGGRDCRRTERSWSPEGLELRRREVEGDRTIAFSHDVACGVTSSTDAAGRGETRSYDGRCRLVAMDRRGAATAQSFDGFGRLRSRTVTPAAGETPIVTRYGYDDALSIREDRGFAEPRRAEQGPSGLRLTYLDGFGRPTKRVLCRGRDASAPDGVGYACAPGPRHVIARMMYREDGLLYADAAPYLEGQERPAFTHVPLRDGLGRALITDRPAPAPADAPRSWSRDYSYFAPERRITVDAVGIERVSRMTTLVQERLVAGRRVFFERMDPQGRVTRRDAVGEPSLSFAYDALGRLAALSRSSKAPVFDPERGANVVRGWTRRFEHDRRDHVTAIVEPDGTRVSLEHDALGRAVRREVVDAATGAGYVETWRYDDGDDGRSVVTHIGASGATTIETRDGLNRLLEHVGPTGVVTRTTHLAAENRVERVREDGGLTVAGATDFDLAGGVIAVTDGAGLVSKMARTGRGQVAETLAPNGATLRLDYAQSGALLRRRRMRGREGWTLLSRVLDAAGRPVAETIDGVRVATSYDALGRPAAQRRGAGPEQVAIELAYDGDSRAVATQTIRVGAGAEARSGVRRDVWRRSAGFSDPEGEATAYSFDYFDRAAQVVDATGAATETTYDYFDRPIRRVSASGDVVAYAYEFAERYAYRHDPTRSAAHVEAARRTDALGQETVIWRDALERVIAQTTAAGVTTEYVYDGARLAQAYVVSADGETLARVDRAYDGAGRLVAVLGPDAPAAFGGAAPADPRTFGGYAVRYAYAQDGALASIDASGERTTFEYEASSGLLAATLYRGLREEVTRTRPTAAAQGPLRVTGKRLIGLRGAARETAYAFDSLGRRTGARISDGRLTEERRWAGFDANGRPARESRAEIDAGGASREVVLDWTYDRRGLPLSRRLSIDGVGLGEAQWRWDARGLMATAQGLGGEEIVYERRADRRLQAVRYGRGGTLAGQVTERDAVGRPTRIDTAAGAVETTWTADGLVEERRQLDAAGNVVRAWDPTYDGLRALSAETWTEGAQRTEKTYAYDGARRLIGETVRVDGQQTALDYALNLAGLRLSTTQDGDRIAAFGYDPAFPASRLTSINGEAVKYDAWDGVLSARGGVSIARSASGLVASVKTEAGVTRVYRDANGAPVAQETPGRGFEVLDFGLDPEGPPLSRQTVSGAARGATTYVRGFGLLLARPDRRGAGGDLGAALYSPVGSVVDGADASSAVSAFGAPLAGEGAAPFGFAGLDAVPGGAGLYLARMRAYDGVSGQFLSPDPAGLRGGLHRTRYAEADPVGYADPLGLWACAATPSDPGGPPPNLSNTPIDLFANTPDFTFGDGITAETRAYYRLLEIGIDISFDPLLPTSLDLTGSVGFPTDPCVTYCPAPGTGPDSGGGGLGDPGLGVVIPHPTPEPAPEANDNDDGEPSPPPPSDDDAGDTTIFGEDDPFLRAGPDIEYVPASDVLAGVEDWFWYDFLKYDRPNGLYITDETLNEETAIENGVRKTINRDGTPGVPVLGYDPERNRRVIARQEEERRAAERAREPVRAPRWTDDPDNFAMPTWEDVEPLLGKDDVDKTQKVYNITEKAVRKVAPTGAPQVPVLTPGIVDSTETVFNSVETVGEVIGDPYSAPGAQERNNERMAEDAPWFIAPLQALDDVAERGREAQEREY